jgi:hypothetical protein
VRAPAQLRVRLSPIRETPQEPTEWEAGVFVVAGASVAESPSGEYEGPIKKMSQIQLWPDVLAVVSSDNPVVRLAGWLTDWSPGAEDELRAR